MQPKDAEAHRKTVHGDLPAIFVSCFSIHYFHDANHLPPLGYRSVLRLVRLFPETLIQEGYRLCGHGPGRRKAA
jgi:hypothetical protein